MNSKQEQLLTARNAALEKELAAKNRELEIETALEKVRAIALSMKEPADMLGVCKIISQQLELLNVKEIRNVQTAIIYDSKGTYLNYEYYAKHDKLLVTEVDYKNHELQKKFAVQMLTGAEELFTLFIEGKEVKTWYEYQKTTNQFADTYLEKAAALCYYWYSLGPVALGISTYVFLNEEEINLFKRFRNVFELAYRRFMDIELAIAQAREAQIELALERVRARTMAMQKSEELAETAAILFQQFKELGEAPNQITIGIMNEEYRIIEFHITQQGKKGNTLHKASIDEPTLMHKLFVAWAAQKKSVIIHLTGKELKDYVHYRSELSGLPVKQEDLQGHRFVHAGIFSKGLISISTPDPRTEETMKLLERFAAVFDGTYTRFLDLQKAEAQAREAKIETALEKVRSRSMAMQKSEELKEVIQVVYEQFVHLNIHIEHTGFVVDYKAKSDWHFWIADKHEVPAEITVPYFDSVWGICYNEAKEKGMDFFATHLNFEEKNKFYQDLLKHIPGLTEQAKEFYFSCPGLGASTILLENVGLYIENFSGTIYTDEENAILMRFGKVFQQTYTRFLDLQKAEAQAREAKIEAALERTRTQSMIMQHSKELDDTLRVFHEQVQLLGIHSAFSFLWLPDEEKKQHIFWAIWQENENGSIVFKNKAINYPLNRNEPATKQCLIDWKSDEPVVSYAVPPEGVENYFAAWQELINGVETLTPENFRGGLYYVEAFMKYGCFGVMVQLDLNQEEKKILRRFAIEFERTYTRFLDLQKAEAQAREGQIELGLERVRARAMAMQKSEELSELVAVLFEELTKLNLILYRCIIWIFNPGTLSARIWMANSEDKKNAESFFIKQLNHPYYKAIINGWKEKNPKWVYVLEGNEKKSIDEMLLHETELSQLSEAVKTGILSSTHTIISGSFNNFGFIEASGPVQLSDEQLDILSRFGKVFDLTYTRFNDLKQAEAQAREAQIEASLERIRSQAMIMRKSEELIEVCKTLLTELQHLGFENIRNTQVAIANDAKGSYMNYDYYNNGISFVGEILYNSHPFIASLAKKMRQNKEEFISITVTGAELDDWRNHLKNLIQRPAPKLDAATFLNYYYYSIGPGGLGFCTYTPLNEEAMNVLKRFKNVFELTYQRYTDVELAMQYGRQAEQDLIKLQTEKKRAEDALTELKATQKQLIQSEKMASLGELTAGIAHEIQNPLNFVNNFSEVNAELIKELRNEVIKGNMDEVTALANDIESNSEKINHHGKRADAIVKGMLQHSRSSSGVKEPTDINALCDEYLRLSYHGLRAKDKSFNATIKTDFDTSIGNINIIPQDIGRVVLNLLTNAFYVVDEKKKLNIPGYEPIVTVSTRLLTPPSGGRGAEIKVADNGNGIPKKIADKIFQPFFTTKPTGQGTGLGLSLSYDIIKAHGGEITVNSKDGEGLPDSNRDGQAGSEFIIKLPNA